MAMRSRDTDDQDIVSEINMTPLIDIMLVLLIIFMVSSSAAIESGLDVTLPEASTVSEKPGDGLVISLDKAGALSVSGQKVEMKDLGAQIAQALKDKKTDTVLFEGDAQSQLSMAVEIMDIARNAGAKNFSIAAKLKE